MRICYVRVVKTRSDKSTVRFDPTERARLIVGHHSPAAGCSSWRYARSFLSVMTECADALNALRVS